MSTPKIDPVNHRDIDKLKGGLSIQGKPIWFYWKPKTKRYVRWLFWSVSISALFISIGWFTEETIWHYADVDGLSDEAASSIALGLISIFIAIYWNLDAVFGRQWIYLAETFNQANTEACPVRSGYIKTMLAVDCWDLKLWNHDTYLFFFEWHVKIAVIHYAQEEMRVDPNIIWRNGTISELEIEQLLEYRRKELYLMLYNSKGNRSLSGIGCRSGLYKCSR